MVLCEFQDGGRVKLEIQSEALVDSRKMYRLIPLLTPLKSRRTVPLKYIFSAFISVCENIPSTLERV